MISSVPLGAESPERLLDKFPDDIARTMLFPIRRETAARIKGIVRVNYT
jgi:hypothetical protein